MSKDVSDIHQQLIAIPEFVQVVEICGPQDSVIRALEKQFPHMDIVVRDRTVYVEGPYHDVRYVCDFFRHVIERAQQGQPFPVHELEQAIYDMAHKSARPVNSSYVFEREDIRVRAKTPGQQRYVDAMERSTIVFGIGPAGTGKTFLAMAQAVSALYAGDIKRIILTRPAVEAGESLGFLPGTLHEKIDPYVRPLYDALAQLVGHEDLPHLMESGIIEVAPLAYMRGRTLNDAFIVLDEAQNTTPTQMKMFLTRLGFHSTMVVTGDISQVDLPKGTISGLRVIENILRDVQGIEFCYLDADDVVRHELVTDIIHAYSQWEEAQGVYAQYTQRKDAQ